MREELLEQLQTWHEEDEYEKIVQAVMDVPEEERDYQLISHLGRALNNLERYEEAVEQFLKIADEGQDDPLWHYRIGLAYYYLDRYDEARIAFETADRLEPGDEDTLEFLSWIEEKTAAGEAGDEEATSESSGSEAAEAKGSEGEQIAAEPVVFEGDFDAEGFWDDDNPAAEKYVSAPPTDALVESVEESLVFRLPAFYVNLMKVHNGGIPRNRYFRTQTGETIEILGIMGIGREKPHSLCGAAGSRATIEREGYPEFGVVLCDTPSDTGVVMLDYRESTNVGEPEVVYVEKASKKATPLAPNFEAFVRGLTGGTQE
ncbi:SMI1/KNR4 family protein [Paenibacillus sp. p3-SID1389]|uniref:SMI1/KNR4 family protein n=1 Tax=Paenibacillus sp. p3-SID1389 TaxID=2916364 RepID=UPI0021A71E09|nr:SMI1/KNR4 family protein [Paenibacillus sp. p3-SID1389]MCT2194772.1 SMI1/KNR4 family protein [Paenibacillus sp. p3-SID1389]